MRAYRVIKNKYKQRMAGSLRDRLAAFVQSPYRALSQQKVRRYRIHLSPARKLFAFTAIAVGMMALLSVILSVYGFERRHAVEYADCGESVCSYQINIPRAMSGPVFMYQHTRGLAQNHMLYAVGSRMEEGATDCRPYYGPGGELVYPCGFAGSTYPDEKYTLVNQENEAMHFSKDGIHWEGNAPLEEIIGEEGKLMENKEEYVNWKRTSTFPNFYKLVGIRSEGLEGGEYTFTVERNAGSAVGKRSIVFISNISRFGVVPGNLEPSFFFVAFFLVLVNCIACYYNK